MEDVGMLVNRPRAICDLCDTEITLDGLQGYGLSGAKSGLKYTKDVAKASKHICNGCMIACVWIFEDSTNTKPKPDLRF